MSADESLLEREELERLLSVGRSLVSELDLDAVLIRSSTPPGS